MPPFAGQGLNSGVRDAMNLCWKVAAVVTGRANSALLDTYEAERRPHAKATIDLSVRLGEVVMTSSRTQARLRDLIVRIALRVPRSRRYLTEMRYRPTAQFATGFLAWTKTDGDRLVGTTVPQTRVLDGGTNVVRRLDDVLDIGGALIGIDVDEADWERVEKALAEFGSLGVGGLFANRIGIALDDRSPRPLNDRSSVSDVEGALNEYTRSVRGRFLLVRPDRVVAAVFAPADTQEVIEALSPFTMPTGGNYPLSEHSERLS
jgi:3-(3-hydroxy-phenyl)propionate hydroxylase